jgi:hypothetical protein
LSGLVAGSAAQIRLDDVEPDAADLLSIFMSQNDPGMCDEWDPGAGGNRALVFGTDVVGTAAVPEEDVTLLAETAAVGFVTVESDDYLDACERWSRETVRSVREVLGHVGGRPACLQYDETPICGTCDLPMSFVVQLEEGSDHQTSINFGGGGCGYGFRCNTCIRAAFLWQR